MNMSGFFCYLAEVSESSGLGEIMEFAFQKLDVWQLAVEFADAAISATENLQAIGSTID